MIEELIREIARTSGPGIDLTLEIRPVRRKNKQRVFWRRSTLPSRSQLPRVFCPNSERLRFAAEQHVSEGAADRVGVSENALEQLPGDAVLLKGEIA